VAGFREFLTEIAAVVADANNEGGFFGLGARPRTPHEAAALEAVRKAAELESWPDKHSGERRGWSLRRDRDRGPAGGRVLRYP
jgi:hypothetical protein